MASGLGLDSLAADKDCIAPFVDHPNGAEGWPRKCTFTDVKSRRYRHFRISEFTVDDILYVKSENMVKLLKQSSISLHFSTRVNGWTTRSWLFEPGQSNSNKIAQPDERKDNIFLKPKMTERMVDDRLERAGPGEIKRSEKTQSR